MVSQAAEAKPELAGAGGIRDDRVRHYVERTTPRGVEPPRFSRVALCGAEVRELVLERGTAICQACVDDVRRRPVEPR